MKRSIIIGLILTCSIIGEAQNLKSEIAEYKFVRMPAEPQQNCVGYHFTVSTPYPENTNDLIEQSKRDHEAAVANYPNVLAESKKKYEDDLADYDKRVEDARENYNLEMENWNKLSKLEKVAMQDKMPVLNLPRKPEYREPYPPVYREPNTSNVITFDRKTLSDSYLYLEGFSKSEAGDNVIVGIVEVGEFEYLSPERKSKEESYYDNVSKTTKKRTVYYYETQYKRPVYLSLTYNGVSLHSGLFASSGEYKTETTSNSPSMSNIERRTVSEALQEINTYLNDKYGFTTILDKAEVHYVKNNKGEYDDLENGMQFGVAGFKALSNNEVNDDLSEALKIWKEVYAETDLVDKKARVDEKVCKIILKNLITACRATNNYTDAKAYLDAFEALDQNYSDKQFVKEYQEKLEDLQARLKANGVI